MFNVVTYPSDILTTVSFRVETFDKALRVFVDSMVETMYENGGVGLAAPQVGVQKRVIVVDHTGKNPVVMINPVITSVSKPVELREEGCLSFPGVGVRVARSVFIDVEYQDLTGQTHYVTATGLHARVIQHEVDHLDGITLLDRAGPLERKMALKNVEIIDRVGQGMQ